MYWSLSACLKECLKFFEERSIVVESVQPALKCGLRFEYLNIGRCIAKFFFGKIGKIGGDVYGCCFVKQFLRNFLQHIRMNESNVFLHMVAIRVVLRDANRFF